MASSGKSIITAFFMVVVTLSSLLNISLGAHHLLQTNMPTIPNMLKLTGMPPLPSIPTVTLPQPNIINNVPPFPTNIPSLPKPNAVLPPLPNPSSIPNIPKVPHVTLPPLPKMPSIPTIPNTIPSIPIFSPPPSN